MATGDNPWLYTAHMKDLMEASLSAGIGTVGAGGDGYPLAGGIPPVDCQPLTGAHLPH